MSQHRNVQPHDPSFIFFPSIYKEDKGVNLDLSRSSFLLSLILFPSVFAPPLTLPTFPNPLSLCLCTPTYTTHFSPTMHSLGYCTYTESSLRCVGLPCVPLAFPGCALPVSLVPYSFAPWLCTTRGLRNRSRAVRRRGECRC